MKRTVNGGLGCKLSEERGLPTRKLNNPIRRDALIRDGGRISLQDAIALIGISAVRDQLI
jgi:hypothetical protein